MKKANRTILSLFSLSFLFGSTLTHARGGNNYQPDPMSNVNYRYAFDQKKIHQRFKDLLIAQGCAENLFDHSSEIEQKEIDTQTLDKKEKHFQKACLQQLSSAHRWALAEPAIASLTTLGIITVASVIVTKMLDKDSFGGSFSIFNSIFGLVFTLGDLAQHGYKFLFPQQSALAHLEKQFAVNQRFIPKDLWPVIIEKFTLAQQNQFEQRMCMNFLEFTLGLTTYKPKPLPKNTANSIEQIIQTLHKKIDQFFEDYQLEGTEKSIQIIKVNVSKFILSLIEQKDHTPRYIYFHGPAGIGKTYFVDRLSRWVEELIPGGVRFESMIITSAEELEGRNSPGTILRVLRNQMKANKRGSVIFMDEATWLNNPGMESAAKRTFNCDQSKISTSYFGDGIDGTGIKLDAPPMLIFAASNDEIKDPALKSRFDVVNFPMPNQTALARHAQMVAKKSKLLTTSNIPDEITVQSWIDSEKIDNFREIEANIEQFSLLQ